MINGPGSYTSLRVGASFLSGLKISKDLPFCQVSIGDFFKFKSKTNKIDNLAFYISSSKNQNFDMFAIFLAYPFSILDYNNCSYYQLQTQDSHFLINFYINAFQ